LLEVERFGFITREQVIRLGLFGSRTRANARLKTLTDAGLLRARPQALPQRGVRLVYSTGRGSRDRTTLSEWLLVHQLGLADIRIAFERTTQVIQWLPERELTPLKIGVVPDAFVEYRFDGLTYAAFVEYDRGTESLSRIEKKVRAYLDLAYSGRFARTFNFKFFRVLLVTDSAGRLATLSRTTARITDRVVRLTTLDELSRQDVTASIWRRPGAQVSESILKT
jgi:hypothetical protein